MYNTSNKQYTDEADNRHELMYKGYYPKKFVKGNINYLDHNILCLENRQPVFSEGKEEYMFHDSITRSKSALTVFELYKIA